MRKKYDHIFGPVRSRRLGRSLGIDLVPFKTCPYDCIYCELGRTLEKTIECRAYSPANEIIREIKDYLQDNSPPDHLTLCGAGEPTLHSGIGGLIRDIQSITDIPVAVLTSGALLWDMEVRKSLLAADIVIPSLDADDERTFGVINRPHPGINFSGMIEGLASFRGIYKRSMWLEIFVIKGINTGAEQLQGFRELIRQIRPDRVQLNSVDRPAAEDFVSGIPRPQMERIAAQLGGSSEVIG